MISEERIKTNQLLIDELNYNEELVIKQNDDGYNNRYFRELMQIVNRQINESIEWLDTQDAKDFFYGESDNQKNFFEKLESQWERILSGKYDKIEDIIQECYEYGKLHAYSDIEEHLKYTEADKLALTHVRNYNFNLIKKLNGELKQSIKNRIFQAVISGENPNSLAPKLVELGLKPLLNSTLSARQRAAMIAKTETSRAQNTGMLQSYVNEGYTEVKILTAEDSNVCYLCLQNAYEFNEEDEVVFDNRGNVKVHNIKSLINKKQYVPLHPNCRCTYLSVWETKKNPPKNPYTTKLINEETHNWSYDYQGKHYQLKGNTPMSRQQFLEEYGLDINKLTPEEELFLKIFSEDSSPLNDYLRFGPDNLDDCVNKWKSINLDMIDDNFVSDELDFNSALDIAESIFNKYAKTLNDDVILCRREIERFMGRNGKTSYDDKGFTSMSIHEFTKPEEYGDELNYILIPKGTKILYVEGITSSPRDYETLFLPNIHLDWVEDLSSKKKVWKLP